MFNRIIFTVRPFYCIVVCMNMMKSKVFSKCAVALLAGLASLLLVALLAACGGIPRAGAAAWGGLGRPTDPVPFMQGVRTGTLPSGLRFFILENSMPENRAFIRLVVNAGSLHEEDHERGLAHFVEHMAFRGTENFPETELVDYLQSLGMRFGPDVNAYVTFNRTVYRIEVPVETAADGTRVIPQTALSIIDDWSRAITFDPAAMETERLVVIEEYRGAKGAWERIRQRWLPVLFRGSRFAQRMPLGQLEVIETATVEDLKNFYRAWYRADNMALIFVGDFDGAALEASLTEHFLIERPAAPTPQPVFDLPPPRRGNLEALVLTDPELTSTTVLLYFMREQEQRRGDIAGFRQGIIDTLIQNMISLRFGEAVLRPESPFIGAWAGNQRWGASSRFFVMEAAAKSGLAEDTLTELLREKEAIRRHGFHSTEIELAKAALVSNFERLVQERDRRPSGAFMTMLTSYYVEGGALPDVEWQLHAIRQLLPGISDRDINNAARDYFAANDVQVFIFAPEAERDFLPDEARMRQLVSQRGRLSVERPRAIEVAERILPFIPERGAVVAEALDAETGATIWQLSNGAFVILQSTENRNDEIVFNAMARGGTSCAPGDRVSALLARDMAEISGLGPWSLTDLSRMLAARQASLSHSIGAYTRSLQGSSTTGDLRTLFEMIYLTFTDTRIDGEAVEVLMDMYRNILAHHGENPQNVFVDELRRMINSDHPHYRALELGDLAEANIDSALAFLHRGLNPSDFVFAFVGNLTPELMRGYVETYLASIPPREESWNSWTDLGIVRPGRVERSVHIGIEEQSIVSMSWFAPAVFSEQLSIATQVLRDYINTRLFEEIRDNLGGVYWISGWVGVSSMPRGELVMEVSFGCDPARVQELSEAVVNLLNDSARSITMSTFNNSVEAQHQALEVSMQSNSFIAQSYVNSAVVFDLPLSRLNRRPQYINAVTSDDLQRILTQLLANGPAKIALFPGQ